MSPEYSAKMESGFLMGDILEHFCFHVFSWTCAFLSSQIASWSNLSIGEEQKLKIICCEPLPGGDIMLTSHRPKAQVYFMRIFSIGDFNLFAFGTYQGLSGGFLLHGGKTDTQTKQLENREMSNCAEPLLEVKYCCWKRKYFPGVWMWVREGRYQWTYLRTRWISEMRLFPGSDIWKELLVQNENLCEWSGLEKQASIFLQDDMKDIKVKRFYRI